MHTSAATVEPGRGRPVDGCERRRLIVWGTGAGARGFVRHLRADVEVVAHVDNAPHRWGTTFEGTPVVAPAALHELDFDMIVIASAFADRILVDVRALGLRESVPVLRLGSVRDDAWRCQELLARPVLTFLQIGLTTRCNLICQHCPRDVDQSRYRDLPLSRFRDYLAAFDPRQFQSLIVSDFGEVTLVRDLLSYLRAARLLGWERIEFVTNATNGRPALWEAIFAEDLARKVTVSLESADAAAFERVRGFGWARFEAGVATIAAAMARHGGRAELTFNAVCMRSHLHDLPGVVEFAARHGARLSLVHLNPSNEFNNPLGRPENHLACAPRDEVVAAFARVVRRARELGVVLSLPEDLPELQPQPPAPAAVERVADLRCTQPLRWVEVDEQGNVYPCCQMAKREPMGNLTTEPFDAIWAGPKYRRLLDGLRPGGTPLEVCRTCNIYNGLSF